MHTETQRNLTDKTPQIMIENMRKYTGLMVVVLILLAAGLIITMKPGGSGGGVGNEFMNVEGVALDRNDFAKQGENTVAAVQRLVQMQNFNDFIKLREFVGSLMGTSASETQNNLDFVTNRILLKLKAQELGLYSSTEVASKYIKENMFQGRDGAFDPAMYTNYVDSLANLGFKESDFQELIGEYIVFTKARELIGGGIVPSTEQTIAQMKSEAQTVGLSTVNFELADFAKAVKPSDEEIKSYWETHKDKYKTDVQLKITYVLTLLDDSDQPQRPTPAPDADPNEVSKQSLEYQEKLADWEEQRKNHTKILTKLFSEFVDVTADSDGLKFDEAAAAAKEQAGEDFTIVTTEAFNIENTPAEINNLTLKHYQPGTQLSSFLFDPKNYNAEDINYNMHTFSVGRDGNLAVRIDERIEPKVKDFEAAKDLAKADLIDERARQAMHDAAIKAQTEIAELLESGKSFNEAAQEKGFNSSTLAPFTAAAPPADISNAEDLFRIAAVTAPKSIAKQLSEAGDTTSIVYVDSRSYETSPEDAIKEQQLIDNTSTQLQYVAFNAWLSSLKDDAEIKQPLVQ
ncbi:SurA N-terminal domain-containing protein [Rubritalea spongiae]|uniref:SurA N-terminal domain-containing protein n=1 Tax=Rubritalea spongiae TaxID=430797 RepID=UPI00366A5DCC